MHPDPTFRIDDRTLHEALIAQVGFGMVFAATPQGLRVGHTPLVPSGPDLVRFHLSSRNALTPHLAGSEALLLVNGPHAYVSPRWYPEPGEVPTWNYVALEMAGPVRTLDDGELEELLVAIGERHEARIEAGPAWEPAQVPQEDWDAMMGSITGFELAVEDWRPTFKLSQNKPVATRERVADALAAEGAPALAALMRRLVK
ncbi:MAG: FMN-binding negative transcriptional regulator [Porphyrobacter sp.]|nr:FMN-binding negative transcriptional regulator [Porphyrobacter sp.]